MKNDPNQANYYGSEASFNKSIKYLVFFSVISLVVLGATGFFVIGAKAQETGSGVAETTTTKEIIEEIVDEIDPTILEETPDEIIIDTQVTDSDLGIDQPTILPDSPFYGVKNLFRGIKKTFTFGQEKKADLEIQYASERVREAELLLEKKEAEGITGEDLAQVQEDVNQALDAYQEDLSSAIERIETLKAASPTGADEIRVERVLDNLTDKIFKQEKIIEKLEGKIESGVGNEDHLIRIIEHKENALEKLGNILTKVEQDPEAVADRLDRIVTAQPGSEFKHLKAMEVLQTIEDKLDSDQAKEAIAEARSRMVGRFEDNLSSIPEGQRFARFDQYMRHMPGNALRHTEIVDEIKTQADLPEDIVMKMEVMKENMARKFENQFKALTTDKIKEQFMRPLIEGDALGNLRMAADLKDRMPEEIRLEIAEHEQASVQKFRAAFTGDDNAQIVADRAERLMRQIRENPDPATFKALDELHSQLTPEQRKFVDQLQTAGAEEMAHRMQLEGEAFFNRISTGNPEDIEIFDRLREFAPPEGFGPPPDFGEAGPPFDFDPNFDPFTQMKEFQTQFVTDHIQQLDDPRAFDRIKAQFDARPDIRAQFERHAPAGFEGGQDFNRLFEEQQSKIDEVRLQLETEIRQRFESGDFPPNFRGGPGGPAGPDFPGEFPHPGDRPGQGSEQFPEPFGRPEQGSGSFQRPDLSQCPPDLDPVCGQDGTTYRNRCQASLAGFAHNGPCETDKKLFDQQRSGDGLNFENGTLRERTEPRELDTDSIRPNPESFTEPDSISPDRPAFPKDIPEDFRSDTVRPDEPRFPTPDQIDEFIEREDEPNHPQLDDFDDFQKPVFQVPENNFQPPTDFTAPSGSFQPPADFNQPPPSNFQPPSGFSPPAGFEPQFPSGGFPPPEFQAQVLGASTMRKIHHEQNLPTPYPSIYSETFLPDMIIGFIKLIFFVK